MSAQGWADSRNRKQRVSRLVKSTRTPRLTRLRLQIVRALRNARGPQTTKQLLPVCFPRLTKFKPSHYSTVRRAAETICVKVGYAKEERRGRSSVLWALRAEYTDLTLKGLRRRLHGER